MVVGSHRGKLVFRQEEDITVRISCFKTVNLSFDFCIGVHTIFGNVSYGGREAGEYGCLWVWFHRYKLLV